MGWLIIESIDKQTFQKTNHNKQTHKYIQNIQNKPTSNIQKTNPPNTQNKTIPINKHLPNRTRKSKTYLNPRNSWRPAARGTRPWVENFPCEAKPSAKPLYISPNSIPVLTPVDKPFSRPLGSHNPIPSGTYDHHGPW